MVLSFKTQPFLELSKMPHGKADAHHVVLNYKKRHAQWAYSYSLPSNHRGNIRKTFFSLLFFLLIEEIEEKI